MPKKATRKKKTPGPQPERLVISGNWKDAMKKSFKAQKPASGWPKPKRKPSRARLV
jgi:hypothetical protein